MAKILRNQERDKEEQRRLAEMGWHCITVWECELKPSKREETLDSIAFTLNRIWLLDHSITSEPRISRNSRNGDAPETVRYSYPQISEEDGQMSMVAEEIYEPEKD